jgi:hypothetical protein
VSKQGGLGDALLYGGYDMSGDVQSLSGVGGGPAALDFTDITKGANARKGGLRDGRIEWTSFFNPGDEAEAAHSLLSALPRGDVIVSYCRGTLLGAPAACLNGKQVNYDGSRGNDGSLTFAVSGQANKFGLEWGLLATPGMRTDTAPTDGDGLDASAGSEYGLQAYLHVADVQGGTLTVTLQDSDDDSTYADITGGAFADITTAGSTQRIATAGDLAVGRYVRASSSGDFTTATFAVVMVRNEVSQEVADGLA